MSLKTTFICLGDKEPRVWSWLAKEVRMMESMQRKPMPLSWVTLAARCSSAVWFL